MQWKSRPGAGSLSMGSFGGLGMPRLADTENPLPQQPAPRSEVWSNSFGPAFKSVSAVLAT